MFALKRKLHAIGGRLLIALPRDWTKAKELGPRDEVEILLDENLTIKAPKKPA